MSSESPVVTCVDLKVGFSCNNNCAHCVVTDKLKSGDLSLTRIRQEIDYYSDRYGAFDLVLTGGELTIREDWERILDYVDGRKARGNIRWCYLQTNGRALSSKRKAARFAETVDCFAVAIHGHNAALHDGITTRRGSFGQTTRAVRNLMEAGAYLMSQTVLSRRNAPHLLSTCRFIARDLKIGRGMITFPHPNGNACSPEIVPTYDDIKKQLNKTVRYLDKIRFRYYAEMIPPCVVEEDIRAPFVEMSLQRMKRNVVGTDASICGGNRDVHYRDLLAGEYRKAPFCRDCRYDGGCLGVWKEYYSFYGGSGLQPVR